jgi:hypothetical protein
MSQSASVFSLKVQRVETSCLFELSWGQGRQLSVTLPYPETLDKLYQEWRADYLGFYSTALRGRVAQNGTIAPPPVNWHARLVEAEAKLLYEFHNWLRRGELFEIRSRIAQAVRDGEMGKTSPCVEVFLTCTPLDLARLPWEAWEIATESGATGKVRFFRTPPDIEEAPITPKTSRRRARILAILGDETGLNFQTDKEAVRSLSKLADIQFVGWQPGQDIGELKAQIIEAIADERGWDVLFFAGHSNETALMGGELAIAPGVSLFLNELEQPLLLAKERGLQFALFNSCNGLSLANTLISWGLSQVAVMREPIHNQVAEEFLVRFLQRLAEYKDVCEALQHACQHLKLEKHVTYPSAYLIPSLFRHPKAPLFCPKPVGIRQQIERWLPTRKQAIALAGLALVSSQLSVQGFLLERRVLVQAQYRQLTNQVPTTKQPPVLLVQIDEDSIREAKISKPNPMDRGYLAQLVDKVSAMNAKVVGIDYLLDRHQPENDQKLANSLRSSVQKQGTSFVFATARNSNGGWFEVLPELAQPNWSLQGDVLLLGNDQRYMTLVPRQQPDPRRLPFSYLLALAYRLNFEQAVKPPQPQLQSSSNLLSQLSAHVAKTSGKDYRDIFSPAARLQPLTNFAYQLRQMWLHPLVDFSIPPEQVYQRLPAWKLLESSAASPKLDSARQPIVIIAPGGYGEAGVVAAGEDSFPLPAAVSYWRSRQNPPDEREKFSGAEAHAYMIHHFLNQRLVVPIPDLWLLAVAALLGKGVALILEEAKGEKNKNKGKQQLFLLPGSGKWVLLGSATTLYGLASLQLYITAAVLLPVLMPAATFWTFILLEQLQRKSHV